MSTSQAPIVQPDVGAQHAKGAVEQTLLPPLPVQQLIDPKVKEALQNGVEKFTENAKKMTSSFEEVAELIGRVDQPSLSSVWQNLLKGYRERLWESKDVAARVASNSEKFEKTLLPLVKEGDRREAIEALRVHQGDCDRIVQVADTQTRHAEEQRRALAQFLERLEPWNNDNTITHQLRRRILQVIHQESMLRKRVARLCQRAGFHYIITNVISPMPEVVWRAAEVSSLPAQIKQEMKKLQDEYNVLQGELNRAQEELHKAEDELSNSEMSKAFFIVRRLEDEQAIRFITSLHTFGVFPEGGAHDCKDLIRFLEKPVTIPEIAPMILRAFEQNRNTIYGAIAQAASKYATGIQSQE